jgi:hypothetical protein
MRTLVAAAILTFCTGFLLPGVEVRAQTAAPFLEQIELTEDAAKNALRAYAQLREDYKDQAPPGSDTQAFAQALIARGAITTALAQYGFSDTDAWYRTLISFIIAHTAGVEGKLAEMRRSLQQLRDTDSIPEDMKEQMIAQLSGLIPSEHNVAVATSVAADPEFAQIIAEIKN